MCTIMSRATTRCAYASQEWHCTIRGSPGTEFEGGLYHVRVLLPGEYPFRPPAIMMLTPNGRFELNTKVRHAWGALAVVFMHGRPDMYQLHELYAVHNPAIQQH